MKTIDRFTIDHKQVDGSRLHNDLNKMARQLNENFTEHTTQIGQLQATTQSQAATIADLLARLTAAGF